VKFTAKIYKNVFLLINSTKV